MMCARVLLLSRSWDRLQGTIDTSPIDGIAPSYFHLARMGTSGEYGTRVLEVH